MRRMMCFGIALCICIFASAAYALPTVPIADPPPSARNCAQPRGLPEADQPLFVAVVSGFFHDAPCTLGAPRVVVFRYAASPTSSDRFTLDVMLDGNPETISGVNIYEIVGRLAEELMDLPMRTRPVPLEAASLPENGVGYLRINSKPWAEVWIDGESTGIVTPLIKHRVGVGRHTVTLKNHKWRCESTFDVTVKAGETVSLVKRLECQSTSPAQ